MRSLLIVLSMVGVALARPGNLGLGHGVRSLLHAPWANSPVAAPLAYSTVAAAPIAYAGHHAVSSQYHAQDELGQYSYGYAGGPSAKSEVKTFDGVTRGGYSYVDAEGKVQSVNYVADPVHGFRVAATNLPVAPAPIAAEPLVALQPVQDTPEVAAAKEAHSIAFAEAKAAADAAPDVGIIEAPVAVAHAPLLPASVSKTVVAHTYAPALAYGAIAPAALPAIAPAHITYQAAVAPVSRFAYSAVAPAVSYAHHPIAYSAAVAPAIAHAPVAYAGNHAVSSQYHAQDELGQYSYGYAGGPSAKSEVKTFDGVTRGGYSYVDANGRVQSVNYVADAINGFRVAATNLPVAPAPIAAEPLVALQPVQDTPEVAAAKEAHSIAFAEAKAAADAAPDVGIIEAPVAVAHAPLLPASVSKTVVANTYAPALAYGAIAPAALPAIAPAHITYQAAVAPVSRFAYSAVAPAVSYAHHPIAYSAAVAPAIAHAPVAYAGHHAVSSQYHAQDELGQYSYGYTGGPSAKSEVKTFDGVTRGGYSYVDANGRVQSVNYVADAINGFRVAATNLPVAPEAAPASLLQTIPDTVEVAAARAEHLAAVEEAKARNQW